MEGAPGYKSLSSFGHVMNVVDLGSVHVRTVSLCYIKGRRIKSRDAEEEHEGMGGGDEQ